MAGTPGNANTDLEVLRDDLVKHASEFQFFQAVRLLRLLRKNVEGENFDEELWRQVKIRPTLSLAFPPNDIESLEWGGAAESRSSMSISSGFTAWRRRSRPSIPKI